MIDFLTGNIYGIAILAAPFYAAFWLLRKIAPRFPHPAIPTGVAVFLMILSFPSYPQYKFEANVQDIVAQAEHLTIVSETHWGAITEPLTWFAAPVGAFRIVGPDLAAGTWYDSNKPNNSFQVIVARYDEPELVMLVDADCEKRTMHAASASKPNEAFRYMTQHPEEMDDVAYRDFCKTDYTEQFEALRRAVASQQEKSSQ